MSEENRWDEDLPEVNENVPNRRETLWILLEIQTLAVQQAVAWIR